MNFRGFFSKVASRAGQQGWPSADRSDRAPAGATGSAGEEQNNSQRPPGPYGHRSLEEMAALFEQDYLKRTGWLETADKKAPVYDGQPIPWFTYPAIRFLERTIPGTARMFEYGGGNSTLYWSKRVGELVTVEHDAAYQSYLAEELAGRATIKLVPENTSVPSVLQPWLDAMPSLKNEPQPDDSQRRRGNLNGRFAAYALQLLAYPPDHFDVVIVDGMARFLSTWAAIQHSQDTGFIVFDNADRDDYASAYELLNEGGFRRIDFWGPGPINPYEWNTAVFYKPPVGSGPRWFRQAAEPKIQTSGGPGAGCECDRLGILVTAFNRPNHLQAVLESLRLQGRIGSVNVWIDGSQKRCELMGAEHRSAEIAKRFAVAEVRHHYGHLGIEKMMLDALDEMSRRYTKVLVLEDDCFPVESGVEEIERTLADVAGRRDVFSVYAHHFGTECKENLEFTRFQGWGWAAHAAAIRHLLPALRGLFTMSEQAYRSYIAANLDENVKSRLDRTPGRDVLKTLQAGFSWDSAVAFLTAQRGLVHRRTPRRAVFNMGITPGIGHFQRDIDFFRRPPFNMISLGEAWAMFDQTTRPCAFDKASYGLEHLDRLVLAEMPEGPGFFVECGAHDGQTQSNSVLLEAQGWRGLLIEASPGNYARCVRTRPNCRVEHAACTRFEKDGTNITIMDVGLMTVADNSVLEDDTRRSWLERGEGFAGREAQQLEVPGRAMSSILDDHGVERIDLLILDVEGAEVDVLRGLDFVRHAPRFVLAEDMYDDEVAGLLSDRGYRLEKVILERRFTRDCLYRYLYS